jgi:hypothetical protein
VTEAFTAKSQTAHDDHSVSSADLLAQLAAECDHAADVVGHLQETIGHILEADTRLTDEALQSLQEADRLRQTLAGLAGFHRGAAATLPHSAVRTNAVHGWVGLCSLSHRLIRHPDAPSPQPPDDKGGFELL